VIRIDEIDLQKPVHGTFAYRAVMAMSESEAIPGSGSLCGQCLRVGLNVLHDDDDLPIRALRDCVPDGQAVRWKMETVGTWQRVCFRKRVGKSWDWFLEQVEDHLMGGVPEWLRQSFKLVPGSVREAKDPVTH
jgi:hypothetical protein